MNVVCDPKFKRKEVSSKKKRKTKKITRSEVNVVVFQLDYKYATP